MKHILLLLTIMMSSAVCNAQTMYVVSVGICDYKNIRDLKKAETDARNIADLYGTHTKNVKLLLGQQATQ